MAYDWYHSLCYKRLGTQAKSPKNAQQVMSLITQTDGTFTAIANINFILRFIIIIATIYRSQANTHNVSYIPGAHNLT